MTVPGAVSCAVRADDVRADHAHFGGGLELHRGAVFFALIVGADHGKDSRHSQVQNIKYDRHDPRLPRDFFTSYALGGPIRQAQLDEILVTPGV